MHLVTEAIVCGSRAHGEHGAIVRALTPTDGLQAGYVPGGRSRRMRPVLMAGNLVQASFRARTEGQLATLAVELVHSRAPLIAEPLPAAAIEWVTALAGTVLPEGQPYPGLFAGLAAVLDAVEAAPSARGWAAALVRFERLALIELGYGEPLDGAPDGDADWPALIAALDANGRAVRARLFADRRDWALDARERLTTRLRRLAG